jgi:NTE family protein
MSNDENIIDTLVLSGGAYLGFYEIGALKCLYEVMSRETKQKVFKFQKIRATSVGSLCAIFFALVLSSKMSFSDIIEYLIGRPWHKTQLDVSPNKQGILDHSFFEQILLPIFSSLDIDINITLYDFSILCDISLEFFTIDVNTTEVVEFSNSKHGNISLINAVHASCAIPFIFIPLEYEGNLYADGGFIYNYPSRDCNQDKTFGIRFDTKQTRIDKNTSMMKYGITFLYNLLNRSGMSGNLKYQITLSCRSQNGDDMKAAFLSKSMREKMIMDGYNQTDEQFKSHAIFSTN